MSALLVFALLAFVPTAQELVEGQEYNLLPILYSKVPPGVLTEDGIKCGKYFYMNSKDPEQNPLVYMEYTSYGQKLIGIPRGKIFMVRVIFFTMLDNAKVLAPSVKWMGNPDLPDPFKIYLTIKISEKDLNEARPCIRDPL